MKYTLKLTREQYAILQNALGDASDVNSYGETARCAKESKAIDKLSAAISRQAERQEDALLKGLKKLNAQMEAKANAK